MQADGTAEDVNEVNKGGVMEDVVESRHDHC